MYGVVDLDLVIAGREGQQSIRALIIGGGHDLHAAGTPWGRQRITVEGP